MRRFPPLLTLIAVFFLSSSAFPQPVLLYQKDGAATNDGLGYSVAGAGDVNGDGTPDLIVGAPSASPGGLFGAGSAFVYSGADSALLFQKDGATAFGSLGASVAGAGDVNGDGKADFIIGAPQADPGGLSDAGSAYVYSYSGGTGVLLYQKDGAASDYLGTSVAGAGDVNGDGKDDFIIGAYLASPGGRANAGSAYVYSGATGALLYQKDGGAAGDFLGYSVAGAGDVNGDGKADFIIGAFYANPGGRNDAGSAYVYYGATGNLLYQYDGAAAGDLLGRSVAGAGDVNGDGKADFIIGAIYADPGGRTNAGSAYVYSGATGFLRYQEDGAAAGDLFGFSVAGAGDVYVDGIGRAEFIIGAYLADPGGRTDAGSAYLYSGNTGFALFQKDGAAGDRLGASVAGAGDVNGDGKADFIIGAPYAAPGGRTYAGSAYVYGFGNTPVGSPVAVTLSGGITLIFDSVSASGNTSLTTSTSGPPPVNGFQILPSGSPLYYALTTTATYVDSVTICFPYDPAGLTPLQEAQVQLQHYVSNMWVDVTTSLDTASNIVCGRVNSFSIFALMAPSPTDVPGEKGNRPKRFELSQNYPNPFNPTTTIRFYLPKRQNVTVEIFNTAGQRVKILLEGEQAAGEQMLSWDGTDEKGRTLSSGTYFYRLKGENFSETKRMMFLK